MPEQISLCLQLADADLRRALAALLPAYLPVRPHDGSPQNGDLVLTQDAPPPIGYRSITLPPLPLRLGALLDRIAAAMRAVADPGIAFGPYRLLADDLDLRRDGGGVIRLTEKEAALLRRLYAAAGKAVERAALLTGIWGYAEGLDTHTVETHVYRLRQKIEADPATPAYVLTEGSGYRLASPT